jgi:2-polyprenyl-3-methyl-5-hydroxy-6-metoxy-1,4-benzoquinol methylase
MTTSSQAINNHYGQADLGVTILTALQRAGKNVNALTRDDIASFDEFHIRGRKATRELARLADLKAGTKVLDLGCGIGGTARTLATEFGCQVTGIDLVDTYIQTAEMLNLRIGLNDDRITFQHGSVLAMPFDNASFEAALSLHLTMNIQDKTQLVQEVRRVQFLPRIFPCRGRVIHQSTFWLNPRSCGKW